MAGATVPIKRKIGRPGVAKIALSGSIWEQAKFSHGFGAMSHVYGWRALIGQTRGTEL